MGLWEMTVHGIKHDHFSWQGTEPLWRSSLYNEGYIWSETKHNQIFVGKLNK